MFGLIHLESMTIIFQMVEASTAEVILKGILLTQDLTSLIIKVIAPENLVAAHLTSLKQDDKNCLEKTKKWEMKDLAVPHLFG